ncbi:ribosomal RNA large subunit methyltransferase F [Patiriisocius marinistellae]|uniref:Ribosomal RNA large subunit methyltransferase F n=1 Tax=Patiriisocius marinistellae TaxID=2494560 RepID=A0A5J4G1G8_9FLAO|nr:23S rRNA (adenine(1618)-N(6))-methyltransferase RlmF [Patiriisocius marinistellae]GEQ86376.1 ribosomal RNA large subunit methyltransferase F [Patiriisocius marinistellae]
MHPKNPHNTPYNFTKLIEAHPGLSRFVFENNYNTTTINFSNPDAVLHLNKAILKNDYAVVDWEIPPHYLCPPIPGRMDYLCYLSELMEDNSLGLKKSKNKGRKGLDIGVGANCIYPILGAQFFGWQMIGADINETAVAQAKANVSMTSEILNKVEIRHQKNNADIFKGIIKDDEYFDFTVCNPPFHPSEEAATKGTLRKIKNLESTGEVRLTKEEITRNFGGQANELWVNGGEALFIKRMIKQSIGFKNQVGVFTTLVSNKENLNKLYKQLDKMKATHRTINMDIGNKRSRMLAWWFLN